MIHAQYHTTGRVDELCLSGQGGGAGTAGNRRKAPSQHYSGINMLPWPQQVAKGPEVGGGGSAAGEDSNSGSLAR
jgi:hypothetical protein